MLNERIAVIEELFERYLMRALEQEKNLILAGDHYTYRDLLRFYSQMAAVLEEDHLYAVGDWTESYRRCHEIRDRVHAQRITMKQEIKEKYGIEVPIA